MKSIAPLIITLTVVCMGAALALSLVNIMTADRIAQQEWEATMKAIRSVLPGIDNDPVEDAMTLSIESEGRAPDSVQVYIGKREGKVTGVAMSRAGEGYGGMINVITGIDLTGAVTGIFVLSGHFETPGLGAKIENEDYRDTFKNKTLENSKLVAGNLAVDKDGGDVVSITGATISPRGVAQAVSQALHIFIKHQAELTGESTGPADEDPVETEETS